MSDIERNPNGDPYGCECSTCKRYYARVRREEERLMDEIAAQADEAEDDRDHGDPHGRDGEES